MFRVAVVAGSEEPLALPDTSTGSPLVGKPNHSETLIRASVVALASVTVTLVPEPEELSPYQISVSTLVAELMAFTQVTPPPETLLTVALVGEEAMVKISAFPACGATIVPTTEVPEVALPVTC